MANEWNTSYPLDHTTIGGVPGAIRALKSSAKTQIDREHETPVDGDATGGEHSSGSAVAYEGTSTPTNRPDGATALANNAIDRGRIWLDDNGDPPNLKRWTGSAFTENVRALGGWTPATYASEESITFPNGLILKHGYTVIGATTGTVTFAAAFPNAVVSISIGLKYSSSGTQTLIITDLTTADFDWTIGDSAYTGFYWQVFGR